MKIKGTVFHILKSGDLIVKDEAGILRRVVSNEDINHKVVDLKIGEEILIITEDDLLNLPNVLNDTLIYTYRGREGSRI